MALVAIGIPPEALIGEQWRPGGIVRVEGDPNRNIYPLPQIGRPQLLNCQNCGAPHEEGGCSYCGTGVRLRP